MDRTAIEMWYCRVLNVDANVDVGASVACAYIASREEGKSLKTEAEDCK